MKNKSNIRNKNCSQEASFPRKINLKIDPKVCQQYYLGNEAANEKILFYAFDLSLHVEQTPDKYLVYLTNFQTRFSPRLSLK